MRLATLGSRCGTRACCRECCGSCGRWMPSWSAASVGRTLKAEEGSSQGTRAAMAMGAVARRLALMEVAREVAALSLRRLVMARL